MCRGTDGHLHRIFADPDNFSDIINDAGICVKEGESFSAGQEVQEEAEAEAEAAADAGAEPALEVNYDFDLDLI